MGVSVLFCHGALPLRKVPVALLHTTLRESKEQGVTEKKVGDTTLAKQSTHCKTLKSGVGALPGPLAAEIWCVKV